MLKLITSLAIFLALMFGSMVAWRSYQFQKREARFDKIIIEKSKKHRIPPSLIKALIYQESKFRSQARGSFKEYGLMQIRSMVADDWCRIHKRPNFEHYGILLTPEMNIEIGTWYLSRAYHKWQGHKEHLELALAQYNAGPKRIYDWQPTNDDGLFFTRITIASTRKYIRIIKEQELKYRKDFL